MKLARAQVFPNWSFTGKKEEVRGEDAAFTAAYTTLAGFFENVNSGRGALRSDPRLLEHPNSVASDESTQGRRTEVVPR